MPSPNKRLRASLFLFGLLTGTPAAAQVCADPLAPVCCPSPCPVFDPVRIPKLLADASNLGQAAGLNSQIIQSMAQIGQTIGNTTAMATSVTKQLSAFPTSISGEVTALQSSLSTNPVSALSSLEQTMFELPAAGQTTAAQMAARSASRISAAQQEQVGALVTSLMKSNSLPSASSLHSQLATTASGSDQLHADLAANSNARLALYQDVGGLHQLTAAWLSQRAAGAALKHPNIAGGTVPQAAAASVSNSQSTSSTQTLRSTVDQLVSLHDNRVSAQALLAAYPSLQQTIASSSLANQFTSSAENTLQKSLSSLSAGSDATLSEVETALQASDASGWLDSGKDAQAQQAAARVLAAMAGSRMLSSAPVAESSAGGLEVQQAMSAWLDANKQSQYWAQLAQNAQNSMSLLDNRLGSLSDQVGLDVAGNSATAAEAALLNRLKQDPSAAQWQGLIAAASQDPGARSVLKLAVSQ